MPVRRLGEVSGEGTARPAAPIGGREADAGADLALRAARLHLWTAVLAAGALIVGFVLTAALLDSSHLSASADAPGPPVWAGVATVGLIALVAVVLFAAIGLARVRRQRRTLASAHLSRVPARWLPSRTRGQTVPGLAVESPDGSWFALALVGTMRAPRFEAHVRKAGAVDIAQSPDYAVVRAPGSTALLSAVPKGRVDTPARLGPEEPLLTLHANGPVATGRASDDGTWFREATPIAASAWLRTLAPPVVVLASIVRVAVTGTISDAGLLAGVGFLLGLAIPPGMLLLERTVTTIDRTGLLRKRTARPAQHVSFDRLATVARFATVDPTGATSVVLTLDEGTTIAISTRRPEGLVAALQRGRVLA